MEDVKGYKFTKANAPIEGIVLGTGLVPTHEEIAMNLMCAHLRQRGFPGTSYEMSEFTRLALECADMITEHGSKRSEGDPDQESLPLTERSTDQSP